MVPDLTLGNAGLGGQMCQARPTHMSYSNFVKYLRTMLCMAPLAMPEVDAARFTTYALRRFLPSVAEALGMAMERRNSLGNWVDNVADNTRQRAPEPMA
eukprot:6135709-Heterocapsa_arctica.AAC.1